VVIVAITVALASLAYSQVHFSVGQRPVYSYSSYSVFGEPSILHLQLNSSAPSQLKELRLDGASSLTGVLVVTSSGYSSLQSLCSATATSFFSVNTTAGVLRVLTDGQAWIDGSEASSAQVGAGTHEVIIAGGSQCTLTLPGGATAAYPSPSISTIPRVGESELSATVLVPFETSGHRITAVYDGGIEVVDF
jgi:hypothetical protein